MRGSPASGVWRLLASVEGACEVRTRTSGRSGIQARRYQQVKEAARGTVAARSRARIAGQKERARGDVRPGPARAEIVSLGYFCASQPGAQPAPQSVPYVPLIPSR